ncbi:hypothetical protein CDL12_05137 [Handroanthus impetiginosus]|uniref:DUF4378 domain-containing protein n=1 Tax=Handroanthus impetiginosus TaxID=429701 RepID=A0A2G9HXB6_9LAMI|nr:hypothetical protein CDL12_05137 [Handroanthus impetiginosus]
MKDFKKRCQPNGIDSVIGKLMGLDQLRPQQPVRGTQRGLSDYYVRKAASIGLRPGSLVYVGLSSSTNNDNVLEKCVNSSTSKVKTGMRSPKPAAGSISKSLSGAIAQGRGSLEKHCSSGKVLRCTQKPEHDSVGGHLGELGIDYMDKSWKPKPEKVACDLEDAKSNTHFGSVCRGQRDFLRPESGKQQHEITYKKLAVDGNLSPRHSCIACSRTMNRISGQERRRSKFEELLRPYMGVNYAVNEVEMPVHSCPYTAKEVQEVGVSHKGQTLDDMLALAAKKSMQRNLNTRLNGNGLCHVSSLQSRSSDSSTPSVMSSMDVSEDNYVKSSSASEFEAINETLSSGLNLNQDESTASVNKSKEQTISEKDVLEPKCGRGYDQSIRGEIDKGSENDTCGEIEPSPRFSKSLSSNLAAQYINDDMYATAEAFDIEASLNEFSEGESVSSNPKKTDQRSPASVLEPFDIQNSSTFECLDSIGLRLQLQALNFEAEETYSEGSVMLISGDDDIEEPFGDLSHSGRKVKRWLGDYESRNFSYTVDVLDEAGYYGTKSFINVFETLEKKYREQTSWQKSERQLLFDRINSGLLEIFNPVINFHACETTIRRRICAALRRDEVEDELWMMLIRQENEKSKDLSEKAIGKWLEFEEGMNIICRDLETSLFDELVMELASLRD